MVHPVIILGTFALAVFLLLNGPLWLSARVRVFAHGPQSPGWLTSAVRIASRAVGLVGILLWLATVGQGNTLYAILLGFVLAGAAFLILGGPLWLVTRTTIFARGREAPARLQAGFVWTSRVIGVAAVASVLYLAVSLQPTGFY